MSRKPQYRKLSTGEVYLYPSRASLGRDFGADRSVAVRSEGDVPAAPANDNTSRTEEEVVAAR